MSSYNPSLGVHLGLGIPSLVKFLTGTSVLKTLNIGSNDLGDEKTIEILHSLKKNTGLATLDLSSNIIDLVLTFTKQTN